MGGERAGAVGAGGECRVWEMDVEYYHEKPRNMIAVETRHETTCYCGEGQPSPSGLGDASKVKSIRDTGMQCDPADGATEKKAGGFWERLWNLLGHMGNYESPRIHGARALRR